MSGTTDPFDFLHNTLRVLFVEDNIDMASVVTDMLGEHPMLMVDTVNTAEKACAAISRNRYHLIILDLGMTDIKGDQFYLLKRYGLSIPIVVLTGQNDMYYAAESMRLGAASVRSKVEHCFDGGFFTLLRRLVRDGIFRGIVPQPVPLHEVDELKSVIRKRSMFWEAIDVLITVSSYSVREWACELGVTDREIRSLCNRHAGVNGKTIVRHIALHDYALDYYFAEPPFEIPARELRLASANTYREMREQFYLGRSVYERLRGNPIVIGTYV